MDGYYTVKEVCQRFRVARETIRRWIRDHGFPRAVHFGHPRGRALFRKDEVEAWERR
jgi:excisionase family DNA binding protein